MKKAIVTGASSGIGKAISKVLLERGYEVYGFGRNFNDHFNNAFFHEIVCDLLDDKLIIKTLEQIKLDELDLLINNAGCAYYGLHETLTAKQIQEMVKVNLEVPMIFTNKLLPKIRNNKGYIINIASVSGTHSAPHGASYGATKAGLISFSNSLFDENRKYDVKVTCIIPDMTDTNLYRNANFTCDTSEGYSLYSDDIANAIKFVLEQRQGLVMNEIIIRPQKNRIKKKN